AVVDVVVDGVAFRERGFDGEDGEAHVLDEVLEHAVLHPEELARAMRRLAEGHHACVADDRGERREILETRARLGGRERHRMPLQPLPGGEIRFVNATDRAAACFGGCGEQSEGEEKREDPGTHGREMYAKATVPAATILKRSSATAGARCCRRRGTASACRRASLRRSFLPAARSGRPCRRAGWFPARSPARGRACRATRRSARGRWPSARTSRRSA